MTIKIDPIEELLKAIGIVHGKDTEWFWRRIIWVIEDKHKWDCVEWD